MILNRSLPYDAEVKYLKNNERAYISIPIFFSADYEKYMELSINTVSTSIFSTPLYCSNCGTIWFKNPKSFTYNYGGEVALTLSSAHPLNQKFSVRTKGTLVHVSYDDEKKVRAVNPIPQYNTVNLFSYGRSDNRGGVYSISLLQIKNNSDELILDLIPVRKGNVGYMYDKVSGQLFGNAGTGDFILGPDINRG